MRISKIQLKLESEGFVLIKGIGIFNDFEFIHPDGRMKIVARNWFYRLIISEE